ncbi:MAG TPA: peptidase C26 [Firmicutes bacterium]|jgi:putative glutamine amidotransferase|nr:gamma-glutamyl-gamma-aminobutyrate hydrolase family protein [Bacillota bacterium]HAA38098.1 peptidase C26 [Bacillota bacterium]
MTVRIGITCNRVGYENRLSLAYVRAVAAAGAAPLLLPVCRQKGLYRQMLKAVDALLLSGGGDLDAYHFGEEAAPTQGVVQPDRDSMELALVRAALQSKMPLLGICRGAQVLAVAAGGSLYQDLTGRAKVQHQQQAPRNYPIHSVSVSRASLLYRITGARSFRVNSFHHQAIRMPGDGMIVSAVAADGVIEAVELPGPGFALGVQWHPEWLAQDCRHAAAIFAAFSQAAECYRRRKRR